MKVTMSWPPSGENLAAFLNTLFTGKLSKSNSPRANRLKQSYAQDIMYGVSNGKIKTPKSIFITILY